MSLYGHKLPAYFFILLQTDNTVKPYIYLTLKENQPQEQSSMKGREWWTERREGAGWD